MYIFDDAPQTPIFGMEYLILYPPETQIMILQAAATIYTVRRNLDFISEGASLETQQVPCGVTKTAF